MNLHPTLRRFLDLPATTRRIGPYHLVKPLGTGSFAPVWLAKEIHGNREIQTVAVKLFWVDPSSTGSSPAVAELRRGRVIDEATALCRVKHPSIIRFHTLVTSEADGTQGILGLVMEYVAGTSLEARLREKGPLAPSEVLKIGAVIASALSAAHRAGLVHRDVKPANILESGGEYKLIDFGIAAAETSERENRASVVVYDGVPVERSLSGDSETGPPITGRPSIPSDGGRVFAGTLGFADPVCVREDHPATPASDIYSLGATLFECLTGRVPAAVQGGGLDQKISRGEKPAPSLRVVASGTPPKLASLIDRMLSRFPEERPPSAEWVAAEMDRLRVSRTGDLRARPPESVGPFRGLDRFEAADRDVYFGRTGEVALTVDLLRTRGLVAIVGPSGSGKSSLARAGVLPAVAEGGIGNWPSRWDTAIAVPRLRPRSAIHEALQKIDPALRAADLAPAALLQRISDHVQASNRGVLLLVDQLEDLAAPGVDEAERSWTIDLLALLGEQPQPGARALVTVRRDLLDRVLGLNQLGKELGQGSLLLISPMSPAVWEEVIDQALDAYGYSLEDDALRRELLGEMAQTAPAMPLVQFALTELWKARDAKKKKITRGSLDAIGGLAGALERHAEAALARFVPGSPGATRTVRKVLLDLTTPQGTRRACRRAELCEAVPEASALLTALEQARLLVREGDEVTLAHDALVTQWQRLAGWVAAARVYRTVIDNLERDALRFQADPTAPLWTRRARYVAQSVIDQDLLTVSEQARDFLAASRRSDLRARYILGGAVLAVVLLVLTWGAFYVWKSRRDSEQALQALEEAKRRQEMSETLRTVAENARKQAEDARKQAEGERSSAEAAREAAELERKKQKELGETNAKLLQQLQSAKNDVERLSILRRAPPPPPDPTSSAGLEPPTAVNSVFPK